jgi:hypothetical protein
MSCNIFVSGGSASGRTVKLMMKGLIPATAGTGGKLQVPTLDLTQKYLTIPIKLVEDKHSSVFCRSIGGEEIKFFGPDSR